MTRQQRTDAALIVSDTRAVHKQIVKLLEPCTRQGVRPGTIFQDWVEICWAALRMQNVHTLALLRGEPLPPDPPDIAALWAEVRGHYHDPGPVFNAFAQAFQL